MILALEFKGYKFYFFLILALCERPAHILLTLTRPNKKKFCSIFLHVVIWTWRRQSQRKTNLEDLPIFISRYDIFTEKKNFFLYIFIYLFSLWSNALVQNTYYTHVPSLIFSQLCPIGIRPWESHPTNQHMCLI